MTSSNLEKSQADAKAALEEKDKKIAALESQNTELDKESNDLRASITNLETQIQSTKEKLAASDKDKESLTQQLKELMGKKAELEKELNDLAFLKEQVKKLKEDLSVARRLDMIRRGIYDAIGQKGAERLMHPPQSAPPAATNILDVEIRQDGGVKIKSPAPTNAPPGP